MNGTIVVPILTSFSQYKSKILSDAERLKLFETKNFLFTSANFIALWLFRDIRSCILPDYVVGNDRVV